MVNSRDSFSKLNNLRRRVVAIKKTEQVPMIIVGNKKDMEDHRQVGTAEGENFAERIGVKFSVLE